MPLSCPACGFESSDGAQCCDFCKEPFAKKRPASPPAPPPIAVPGLDDELRPGQDGETVPAPPKWLKPFALSLVGVVALAALVLAAMLIGKMRPPR